MSFRRPWSSLNSTMQVMEESGAPSLVSATRSKGITGNLDKRTPEERVFGKGLFASYPNHQATQTHGIPLYIFTCGVCIVISCLLVILLATNILIQLRTIVPDNIFETAVKAFYVVISLVGIYALIVGNSWLFRKLSSKQKRNSANAQYSSLNRLEENYEMDSL
ncbi:hypothetical protein ZYGR_0S00610 [Zygosaccharomyces rouxii]|uniref:ZYRO0F03806p n=2 Tax=Zygosaccharomyces rouxii TaxID=4956 RepID=C5DXC0_ZYGRC|nr:uncharacterized protein ZYRO0F03806g [Zygosaccharomyces rouxii]KAH9199194.1 hypothetical protein LQ764DRAFT_126846 [Zygosaccharomyces rouxii]GAV49928.1 hypothetical protein ZYGR_0S00610 [Zygosaccharomyces rouxii]CAR28431.1 ZYRO0F03806p [Zygosaccharomyces rouxii]